MDINDEEILNRYRDVFRKFSKDGIIDMDRRLKHKFDFHIDRVQNIVRTFDGIVPPNRQSVYYISFFHAGKGEKWVGNHHFPLVKNTLYIIPQRIIQSTVYQSPNCSGYLLSFNINFFLNNAFPQKLIKNKRIFRANLRPYLVVTGAQRKRLDTIFEFILAEYSDKQHQRNEMIAIKILELMILCDRFFTDAAVLDTGESYHASIEKFTELIEQHFNRERQVQFYADAMNIHPAHLNFLVKKFNGLNAKKTIDNRIILEAQSLFATSSMSVKEVANALGFSDVNYFSSFFRKMTSMPPTQYRKAVMS